MEQIIQINKKAMVFIGTSGFAYERWRTEGFYPEGLPKSKWLEHYAQFLNSVELNFSFHYLPSENTFMGWYRRTPSNFSFAVKGSQFITHIKKLNEVEAPLRLFLERINILKEKLSIVLWQLPPMFKMHADRLSNFVSLLRKLSTVSHTFEFRNESWFHKDVYRILHDANMAICIADRPKASRNIPTAANFVYIRRHKIERYPHRNCYTDAELRTDAKMIKSWLKEKKNIFVYFNNSETSSAVKNAITLLKLVEG